MNERISLGTASAQPGSIQYGRWDFVSHPTGSSEFLPVIIASGRDEGPCLWLTAGIHGTEHSGPSVLYRLLTQDLVETLSGTIVAIPALSPVGLRTEKYVPYHVPKNPNRLWPDGKPTSAQPKPEKAAQSSVELAYARLFERIKESANFLIDYHNYSEGSIPFAFRDRVLFRHSADEASARAEAEQLSERMDGMLQAFGHTIVNEFPAEHYIEEDLHRSTSGATLLLARVPAITVELGTGLVPEERITTAAVAGTRNVLRWAGMLSGEMEPISGIPVVDPGFPARRTSTVRTQTPCVVLSSLDAGAVFQKGDVLAELGDIWGRPLPDGLVRADHDGFVVGRQPGILHYPGATILRVAIRDDAPLTGAYPKDFFVS
jgi:predicted deacylase